MLAVAVCIGGGDVDEGLQMLHLMGQTEELLRADDVQLQGESAGDRGQGGGHSVTQKQRVCGGDG